jgi:hypothetical protein
MPKKAAVRFKIAPLNTCRTDYMKEMDDTTLQVKPGISRPPSTIGTGRPNGE